VACCGAVTMSLVNNQIYCFCVHMFFEIHVLGEVLYEKICEHT
jgi:hypothetical protein